MAMEKLRLFLGGMYDGVTEADIKQRFGRFGNISSVDIREKKDDTGEIIKTGFGIPYKNNNILAKFSGR